MKTCLVVIDYQYDFVEGALGFEAAKTIEARIIDHIRRTRKEAGIVVFTLDTHDDNYLETEEGRHLPIKHCLKGTPGHCLTERIEAMRIPEDPVFEKPSFPSLELGDYLRQEDFAVIRLVGLVSNICVLSNAVIAKAACPEAKIIIDAAATASFDMDLHEKAFDIMAGLHIHIENRG
ncbi:MAG: cysteine hydrolase [Acholeplasmatales bacterium]|nr:MAG: cysteine hydrolase [Acholeplasmatales bacterium]